MVAETTESISTPFRENAVLSGKRFKARLLRSGVVSYKDFGLGNELLRKETIDAHIGTFINKPIIVRHKMLGDSEVDSLGRQNGVIHEVKYNPDDEWYYAHGEILSQEVLARVNAVGKVSCGYVTHRNFGPPGSRNNVPYEREILGFTGNHLAIEERPRYEDADIRWNSLSRQTNQNNMNPIKWFFPKKQISAGADDAAAIAAAAAKKKQEEDAAAEAARLNSTVPTAEDIPADTKFIVDGKEVTAEELATAYRANSTTPTEGALPADAAFEIDGKQVPAAEVIAGYRANAAKPVSAAPAANAPKVFRISETRAEHSAHASEAPGEIETMAHKKAKGKVHY